MAPREIVTSVRRRSSLRDANEAELTPAVQAMASVKRRNICDTLYVHMQLLSLLLRGRWHEG